MRLELKITHRIAVIAILGIRMFNRRPRDRGARARGDLTVDAALGASLLLFAAALSLPGTNVLGLACFWVLIAAAEISTWGPRAGQGFRRWQGRSTTETLRIDPAQPPSAHIPSAAIPSKASPGSSAAHDLPASGITQQLTRSSTVEGGDVLCGTLRLDFSPGQRTGNLHVAFCPPFAVTPEMTAVQADGPQARIKIAQLLPYGVRLEVKLAAAIDRSAAVVVQITARAGREN